MRKWPRTCSSGELVLNISHLTIDARQTRKDHAKSSGKEDSDQNCPETVLNLCGDAWDDEGVDKDIEKCDSDHQRDDYADGYEVLELIDW